MEYLFKVLGFLEYYKNELDGKHIVMHANKMPSIIEHYEYGVLHGPRIESDKNGQPLIKSEYYDGELHGIYIDLSSGIKCHYQHGQLNGNWLQMIDGQLIMEASFENNELHGEFVKLNDSGTAYEISNYYRGQLV